MRIQLSAAVLCVLGSWSWAAGPSKVSPEVRALGYDIEGQLHDNASLPVKSIVFSGDKVTGKTADGDQEHKLSYRVCNVDKGDKAINRVGDLYFQWKAAGFMTTAKRELEFETCLRLETLLTWDTTKKTTDIQYLRKATSVPVLETYVMDMKPPAWNKRDRYWHYGFTLYKDLMKGMSSGGTQFRIFTVRKRPSDKGAYQTMWWKPGSEMYMTLPRLSPQDKDAYLSAFKAYGKDGVRVSLRPGFAAAGDFQSADDNWVRQAFEGRDVLKLERDAEREKEGELRTVLVTAPTPLIELVVLTAVLRDRKTGQAEYQVNYVTAGN